MCLMLYVGSTTGLPAANLPDFRVEEVDDRRATVKQWFSMPVVQFIGGRGGCSCAFPSVVADAPVDFFEGMISEGGDREADLRSVNELLLRVRGLVASDSPVELLPVWDGDQSLAPKGKIQWDLESLDASRFVFNERYLYVIRPIACRTLSG